MVFIDLKTNSPVAYGVTLGAVTFVGEILDIPEAVYSRML